MKKLITIIFFATLSITWLTTMATTFAQSENTKNPFMAAIELPDSLRPQYAPDVKIAANTDTKKGFEAAYANLILQTIAGSLLYLAGPLAIAIIAISGLRYVTAHGNQTYMDGAKKTLMYAIVGLLITIFSYAIVKAIIALVVSTTG